MTFYRVVLSLHVIAIISWMAGILYLYRLFVYHAEETEAVVKARFQVMETKLMNIILTPAMGVSLLLGIVMLILQPETLRMHWFHAKLTCVVGMMFMSHYAGKLKQELRDGTCKKTSRQLRFLNEVPTLLMIGIVFMVILRPF